MNQWTHTLHQSILWLHGDITDIFWLLTLVEMGISRSLAKWWSPLCGYPFGVTFGVDVGVYIPRSLANWKSVLGWEPQELETVKGKWILDLLFVCTRDLPATIQLNSGEIPAFVDHVFHGKPWVFHGGYNCKMLKDILRYLEVFKFWSTDWCFQHFQHFISFVYNTRWSFCFKCYLQMKK